MPELIAITRGALAFFLTVMLIHLLRRPARRIGLVDKPGARKHHIGVIPLTGGIAMFGAFILSSLTLSAPLQSYYSLLAALVLLIVVGVFDDLHELATRVRFLAQIAASAIMITLGNVYLFELGDLLGAGNVVLNAWSIPFTVFCVVGVINAINMADGLDGLAGGQALIATGWLILLSMIADAPALDTSLLLILAAVLAGFLCFNLRHRWRQRAAVFMGDAGSMALGFVLCWFLVGLSQGEQRIFSPMIAVWIMGLPLMDTVGIMVRRALHGLSPFAADRRHLHHLLLSLGFSDGQTTAMLLAGNLLISAIGVTAWFLAVPEYALFYTFWTLFFIYYYALGRAWRARPDRTGNLPAAL